MVHAIHHLETSNNLFFPKSQDASIALVQNEPASTQRASLRRMRRETQTTELKFTETSPEEKFEKLIKRIETLIRVGCYSKVIPDLEKIEQLIDQKLIDELINGIRPHGVDAFELRPAMNQLKQGLFSEIKAYILALEGKSDAIALCDEGFENLKSGIQELMDLAKTTKMTTDTTVGFDVERFEKGLEMTHQLFRGMLALSLNAREMAIDDLRSGLQLATEVDLDFDPQSAFLIKALEQKLEVSLLPESMIVDEKNPKSLMMAGRYEEALELLDTLKYPNREIRAACLALLGRHKEALELLKTNDGDQDNHSECNSIIHFLRGDYEKAKDKALNPRPNFSHNHPDFGYLVLLAITAFEKQ